MFGVVLGLFGILRLVLDYSRHPSLGGRSVVYQFWLVSFDILFALIFVWVCKFLASPVVSSRLWLCSGYLELIL